MKRFSPAGAASLFRPRRSRGRRAFTLVEILVGVTIMALISVALLRLLVQALNIYMYDTGKILINKDIRKFTSEMTENATYANYFRIYPSYSNLNRTVLTYIDSSDPDQGMTEALADTSVNDGASGDCLVLIYKDPADDRKVSRIITYFRAPANPNDPLSTGPVRRWDQAITPSSDRPIANLIGTIRDPSIYPEVVELSRGLANGKLFYNFYDRSIIVKGEIIHRGGMINSRNASATNTYNFTVSPRG